MPSIFLSYRRDDASAQAGRLYDRLEVRFGERNVFRDLDTLKHGEVFAKTIDEYVGRCDALLAVIGQDWLKPDEHGRRRIDDPADWVRREIAVALSRPIRVIPVLVDGATLPQLGELPADLQPLRDLNTVALAEATWTVQVNELIAGLATADPNAPWSDRVTEELARILPPGPPARGVLTMAGFPPHHIPAAFGVTALEFWYGVREQLLAGVLDDGFERVLAVARSRFSANPILRA